MLYDRVHVGVGINKFDLPGAPDLGGCVADAVNVQGELCDRWGFAPAGLLLDEQATIEGFKSALLQASGTTKAYGLIAVSLSCHGDQQPDEDGDEADGFDERLVFHDDVWTDDAHHAWLCANIPSTQTLLLWYDLCHSGTVARQARVSLPAAYARVDAALYAEKPGEPPAPRFLPAGVSGAIGRRPDAVVPGVGPGIILAHACRDDETAGDEAASSPGGVGGTFTKAALGALQRCTPQDPPTYREWGAAFASMVPKRKRQHPGLKTIRAREFLDMPLFALGIV